MAHVPASLYTRNGTRAEHTHDALLATRGLQPAATAAAGVAAAVGGDRRRVLGAADLEAATGHGAEHGLEARAGRLGGGAAGGAHLEVDGGECPAPSSARTSAAATTAAQGEASSQSFFTLRPCSRPGRRFCTCRGRHRTRTASRGARGGEGGWRGGSARCGESTPFGGQRGRGGKRPPED